MSKLSLEERIFLYGHVPAHLLETDDPRTLQALKAEAGRQMRDLLKKVSAAERESRFIVPNFSDYLNGLYLTDLPQYRLPELPLPVNSSGWEFKIRKFKLSPAVIPHGVILNVPT